MSRSFDFDAIRRLLPVSELRPLLDAVLRSSGPDPADTWSGAGELATFGARIIDPDALGDVARDAARSEADRIEILYGVLARSLVAAGTGDTATAAARLVEAAEIEERRGRPGDAAALAEAAAELALRDGHIVEAALALRRRARATRGCGRLEQALGHYLEAVEVARSVEDHEGHAEAAVGAGNVLEQQGRWSEAERWYHESLATLELLENPTSGLWHALLNVHIVLRSRGALSDSAPWLDRAVGVAESLDDPDRHPFLGNARGQLAMAEGDPERAEKHFQEALRRAPSPRAAATIRLNLAESLLCRARGLDAAECAREAERDALMTPATDKLPEVYRMLGRVAAATENPDAFVLFERALERTEGNPQLLFERAQTLQAYADAEALLGRRDTAVELWRVARSTYRELGVAGFRRTWADCFDAPFPTLDPKDAQP